MFTIKQGVNSESLLSYNRSLVLHSIQRMGVGSRAEIAKQTGLTQASISKIVNGLMQDQVVHEVGYMTGEMGRRSIGVSLNADNFQTIGLKLSRRSFSVGVFDISGKNYETKQCEVPVSEPVERTVAHIRELIGYYADTYPRVVAIGAAVPGPFFKDAGVIGLMTETKGWEDIPLFEAFSNIRGLPVFFEHDANSAAMAEWLYSDHEVASDGTLVYLLADEGIGAGVVHNGQIFSGHLGTAGEIGHISVDVNGPHCACGNRGCLELYCSSLVFVRKTKEKLASFPNHFLHGKYATLTCDDVFEAARMGDPLAQEMTAYAAKYLACGVVTLIHAYNPQCIVIGNAMANGGDQLLSKIRAIVKERLLPALYDSVNIKLTGSKIDPILSGAAAIASDHFFRDPTVFVNEARIG